MAIVKKPTRNQSATALRDDEKTAEAFISGVGDAPTKGGGGSLEANAGDDPVR